MESRLRRTAGRTYYESSIEAFVSYHDARDIVDYLTESDESSDPNTLLLQKRAWSNQIDILKKARRPPEYIAHVA